MKSVWHCSQDKFHANQSNQNKKKKAKVCAGKVAELKHKVCDSVPLSVDHEILVDGDPHLHSSVIAQVKHSGGVGLPPVLPSVGLHHPLVELPILVNVVPGGGSDPISVKARVVRDAISPIHLVD